jgi:2,3,4,5-tetrahydropyridine-2-carboxylate N-succinyltransferase
MLPVKTRDDAIALLDALEAGRLRAAEPEAGVWRVNAEVKEGILQVFRLAENVEQNSGAFAFRDRDLLLGEARCPPGVRVVPGGTMIRRGAHVASGVVIMPPAYVNIGAFVDCDSMIDSHALVGSCAQIGRRVHLSAGAQIGGVLEPIGALPIIVEDDAFIGGNCGVYDGVMISRRAVLAAGVVLTASSPVYDLVNACEIKPRDGRLTIPPDAVVISGTRPASGEYAKAQHLMISAALIVKYRDGRTDARTSLESALR